MSCLFTSIKSNVYYLKNRFKRIVYITYVREPCNYVCIHIIWQCRKSNNIYIHYSNFNTQIPAGWHAHLVLSVSQGCPLPQGRRWSPRIFWFKNDLWRHKEINKTLIAGLAGDSKHCDQKRWKMIQPHLLTHLTIVEGQAQFVPIWWVAAARLLQLLKLLAIVCLKHPPQLIKPKVFAIQISQHQSSSWIHDHSIDE